jgi:hypothetical protein
MPDVMLEVMTEVISVSFVKFSGVTVVTKNVVVDEVDVVVEYKTLHSGASRHG